MDDGIYIFQWSFDGHPVICEDCASVEIEVKASGKLSALIIDEEGCVIEAFMDITVLKERPIYSANVFSPNGDDINDRFFLQSSAQGEVADLRIFDRWGGVVFASRGGRLNDAAHGWDGLSRGQAVYPGTYVWVADIRFSDGVKMNISGSVLVLGY